MKAKSPIWAGAFIGALAAVLIIGCSRRTASELKIPPRRGGFSPQEALARMQLAPGFRAALFASEPDIYQPIAMNWDDRGRMWVVEYLQYPDPAGLKALEWDRYFRTKYDRVPEPPPHGPRGMDRIKILEDTDGDGQADRVKIFVDGLNLATGVAVGYGGVYVAQAPYLLFYPDRDGDDRPDGPPEVLLSGFGMEDAHALVNSLTWGPDGWLYGAQGSTVTAHVRGYTFQQGIWRFHPITKEFELFAEGGGNTWSFDWDADGNLLCGTNYSHYALLHMVQGGYYVKTFEKHGPLSNPYAFGYFQHAEHRGPFKGGHVTIGGLTYQADAYPPRYRGKHIAANILSNAIYWFDVEPVGSTFATRQAEDMLIANDPWFRPVDLTTGPDGAVYAADWYDIRATHNNTREDNWDKGSGRIYRLDYQEGRRPPRIRLGKQSSAELVGWLKHPNEWFHREARRILAERRDPSIIPGLRKAVWDAPSDHEALEYLWALYVSGGFDEATALPLLAHPRAPVRVWAVRFLGDAKQVSPAAAERLAAQARDETDAHVRSQLASSARRLPAAQALPIIVGLLGRDADAGDLHIPLLVWWAIERQVATDRDRLVDMLSASWNSALVRRYLAERLARRLASTGSEEDVRACARLLASAPDRQAVDLIASGIDLGLAGRGWDHPPAALQEALAARRSQATPGGPLIRLAARLGDEGARQKARAVALDRRASPAERIPLISLLGEIGGAQNERALLAVLARKEPEALYLEDIKALGRFTGPEIADALLRRWPEMSPKLRDRAVDLLASRKDWARKLIRALGPDFRRQPAGVVQKILQHQDAELTALVEKSWGHMQATDREKVEKARRLAGIVGPPELFDRPGRPYDRVKGKAIFDARCSRCHTLFGEGGKIGPDLTGAERRNIDVLMQNIVDPSAAIRAEYASFIVTLKDRRMLTGFIPEATPESLVVMDDKGEKTVVARSDVSEVRESPVSLMPEGLLDDLDNQSLVDFFAYLTAKGKTSGP